MERYEVILAAAAAADIREIVGYLAVDLREPATAAQMLERFDDGIRSLSSMPERNPLVADPDFAARGLRIQAVRNYLMFYVVNRQEHQVHVIRVQYGRRNWISILTESNM